MIRYTWGALFCILQFAAEARAQLPLPAPWQAQDIGNVGIAGSASRTNDGQEEATWNVNGSGGDIWGTADSFFFVYRPVEDGAITVNPPAVENTNPHAKAGIMIRQTTDPGSVAVILDAQPDGSIEFMARTSTNGEMQFIKGAPPISGGWILTLSRHGGYISGTACTGDGLCIAMGDVGFPSAMALIGLAVTSHDNSVLNRHLGARPMPSTFLTRVRSRTATSSRKSTASITLILSPRQASWFVHPRTRHPPMSSSTSVQTARSSS